MTVSAEGETTFGNLYSHRHGGWQNGTRDWDTRQLVGEGGWQDYKFVLATSKNVVYAIDWDGSLWWYRFDGGAGRARLLVDDGWAAIYTSVFATSDGVLYGITPQGDLYWHRHKGWETGTRDWDEPRLVGSTGWTTMYTSVFATSDGVLYGITPEGDLYWNRHKGWETGTQEWDERRLVGSTGWTTMYTSVFATSDGVLYGITPEGDLYWYRHDGWLTGTRMERPRELVGESVWAPYSQVFASSSGTLFAIVDDAMAGIEHVVVLMLENRSLDSMLGWLYEHDSPMNNIPPLKPGDRAYEGLQGLDLMKYRVGFSHSESERIPPIRGANALNCPNFSPGEEYDHVWMQQFYDPLRAIGPGIEETPTMGGFVADYVEVLKERGCTPDQIAKYADQVMRSYTPAQLPVLNGLAKHYAVCDMWFSSVPSQTNTNRAFAFCGTSNGMVNNGFLEEDPRAKAVEEVVGYKLGDDRVHAPTIFNALAEDGNASWKVYYRCGMLQENIQELIDIYRGVVSTPSLFGAIAAFVLLVEHLTDDHLTYMRSLSDKSVGSVYSYRLFPKLKEIPAAEANFEPFEKFHAAARSGKLPNFTFIEPVWTISPQSVGSSLGKNVLYHLGDDYHPPCNMDAGENLVKGIYESLISNTEAWNKTLFIITFDEAVGAFDHVPPPAAIPPWGDGPSPPCQEDFNFDRFGARVPTLLISPLIEKGTVFRSTTDTPFDHTSLIHTLLRWRKRRDKVTEFGERTRRAPTFEKVLTRTKPRSDARSVPFLIHARKLGDPVRYFDRFSLQHEDGRFVASFEKALAEGAVWGGWMGEKDAALTEFFPVLSSEPERKSLFYCVNPDDRIDEQAISRQSPYVKLVGLDIGLMSYNVLGAWGDSADCYYSNDYIEGELDRKERWHIEIGDEDGGDGTLRYGQEVVIKNESYGQWLHPDREWVTTSRIYRSKWKVLPP